MTRSIRLVVAASSPVLSVDDETKRNVEKHECSLLKVVSDAGSTPAASTNSNRPRATENVVTDVLRQDLPSSDLVPYDS